MSKDTEGIHSSTYNFHLDKNLHTVEIAFESISVVANDFAQVLIEKITVTGS